VAAQSQLEMLIEGRRLVERATRWLVRNNPGSIDISLTNRYYQPGAEMMADAMPAVLDGVDREAFDARATKLREAGVPEDLARRVAGMPLLLSVFDIVEVERATKRELGAVMSTYLSLGS